MYIGKVKAVIEKKKPSGMKFFHAYGKNKSDEQVFISGHFRIRVVKLHSETTCQIKRKSNVRIYI